MAFSTAAGTGMVRRWAAAGSVALLASLLIGAHAAGAATSHTSPASRSAHRVEATCKYRSSARAEQAAKKAATKQAARKAAARLKAQCAAEAAKASAAKAEKQSAVKAEKASAMKAEKASAASTEKKSAATESAVAKAIAQQAAKPRTDARQAVKGNTTDAGKQQALLTSVTIHQQQLAAAAAAARAAQAASAELTRTAQRQASAVGSAFTTGSARTAGTGTHQSGTTQAHAVQLGTTPRTATHPVQPQRARQLAVSADQPAAVQIPIQLAEAGLSLGVGPLVLLGFVIIGGLATVVTGTQRRVPGRRRA